MEFEDTVSYEIFKLYQEQFIFNDTASYEVYMNMNK